MDKRKIPSFVFLNKDMKICLQGIEPIRVAIFVSKYKTLIPDECEKTRLVYSRKGTGLKIK